MTPEIVGPYWKSSYSMQEGNCVEIADTIDNGRAVRDSKDQRGAHLTFTGGAWQTFLQGVKRREFDR
ncbi:DUF397 domain-containing protein [Streptomyces sp. NPDC097640]|uniref:DUF397 domain-containing protein n=1 Tax=Streptomyces sp. NPDC097640 TaxID=3157229 RepID=UPI003333E4D7